MKSHSMNRRRNLTVVVYPKRASKTAMSLGNARTEGNKPSIFNNLSIAMDGAGRGGRTPMGRSPADFESVSCHVAVH